MKSQLLWSDRLSWHSSEVHVLATYFIVRLDEKSWSLLAKRCKILVLSFTLFRIRIQYSLVNDFQATTMFL
jgi:hypothetical protein